MQETTKRARKPGGGRKPLYTTPEDLQAAVDRYFESCAGVPAYDKNGIPILKRSGEQRRTGETPPTLTGLAHFCGYKDRRIFTRQRERGTDFESVVLEARTRIEEFYERALYDSDTCKGAMFMLSVGFGWRKVKVESPG